ncbi:uncharacterized protein [Dermacentor andersoni]|uniref:uncharacterized protein n=1 Tax=Dermacentor andersoni TaxID=34620 RepID=UPI002415EAA9|nr:uncharacterized protein LOC129385672 [Dermacentor andersoni]XP_054928537.1 uncharacterized protein LOC129385672 [Dermacentor andersoni]XP_054928538.1 uncharacterized protein LOC129385672 [Dermacentor andersoni]
MTTFNQASIIFLLMCVERCIAKACSQNKHVVDCPSSGLVPGGFCPGMNPPACERPEKVCVCMSGYFQRWDGACVPYRDCVFRAFNPEKLLSLDEDLVMVGLSTSIFEKGTLKCFVSTLVKPIKHKFHRLVTYKKEVGSNWLKMHFDLRFYTSSHYGEKLLVKDAWKSLPYGMERFSSLHATKDCIILGKMPPYGQKTECTYWVRRSVVGNRNWQCDFIFDAFCKFQAIVVNKTNIDTCK